MKNIAIVEDNDQYASVITEYINKYMVENNVELNIIRFHNADEFLKDYQQERILAWLYPEEYSSDTGYQQQNSIIAKSTSRRSSINTKPRSRF